MKQPHHILAVRIAHPVWTLFLLALALAVDHTGIGPPRASVLLPA